LGSVRTGQAHRTLTGHTAPVTCLQFDENNIVTGSLDKTIRVRSWPAPLTVFHADSPQIWDIRTGAISEVHRFEYPVTALQFDSRKVVACTGENGVEVRLLDCGDVCLLIPTGLQPDDSRALEVDHKWAYKARGEDEVH
jgi:division protein 1